MILYQDKYPHSSRMIWVEYNGKHITIRLDLQDLGEDFEYERSMSDISLEAVLLALGLRDLIVLYAFLQENYSSSDAMDRISNDILNRHKISYLYYSC